VLKALVVASSIPLVALGLAGCPGSLEDPERFALADGSACLDVPTTLLGAKCATGAGCHVAEAPGGDLDLVSPGLAARLVDVPASSTCGGTLLVDSSDPEASLLYQKVLDSAPCGSRMPLGGAPLVDVERACLLEWITELDASSSATTTTTTSAGGGGGAGGG
jgi:hypothetical protein